MTMSQVRAFALALPEVNEEPHHHLSSFRVRGKIFVTVLPDEQTIRVFVGEDLREPALTRYPEFLEKLFWGKKAVGLGVALARAKPAAVESLIRAAWALKAPKSLQQQED
ncbi:MAG: MmcQ/YjbR family DNA-binding protein [Pseudomonadota bacterium]